METCASIVEFVEDFLHGVAETTRFASGAVNIDIRYGSRFVVIQYVPSLGFGVSEIEGDDGQMSGHDAVFTSPDAVVSYLRILFSSVSDQ